MKLYKVGGKVMGPHQFKAIVNEVLEELVQSGDMETRTVNRERRYWLTPKGERDLERLRSCPRLRVPKNVLRVE